MTNVYTPKDTVKREGVNRWILSGKVQKKTFKYSTSGNAVFSCMVVIPAINERFTTKLFLKAFKTTAEELNEKIKDGGAYWFTGYISNNSFQDAEGKKVYRDDFVITKFDSAEAPEWVKKEGEESAQESGVPF